MTGAVCAGTISDDRSGTEMPIRPPHEYRTEAKMCRLRADASADAKFAAEWRALADHYDRIAEALEIAAKAPAPKS
jgi:hypothetical protein